MWLTMAAIIAVTVFVAAAIMMAVAAARMRRAADETIKIVREELIPLLQESRASLRNANTAVEEFREKVDRLGRIFVLVEELLGGGALALAASKAAQTSSLAAKGLLEALKLGVRALRGAPKQS